MTPLAQEFARARLRRDVLRGDNATDALRLLDGLGDGAAFDRLFIDDFAGRWLVQTSAPGLKPPEWLAEAAREARSVYWKVLDAQGRRPPAHWCGERVEAPFAIRENGLLYQVDFQAGYSQGIFLDQRDNRLALRRRSGPGKSLLNCFAYTCAFSVAAAAAGAATVSVDLSRRYLDWGRENFRLNGIDPAAGHEFLSGDAFDWMRRLQKKGRSFDLIVLDPPTFSRNRDGAVFRASDHFGRLVESAAPLLAPGGALLCSTNQRSLGPAGLRGMIAAALGDPARWRITGAPMPPDFTGEPYLQSYWAERLF